MKKFVAVMFSVFILASGASASMIPENITIDFNIGLDDDEDQQKNNEAEEGNNTYGEREDGQSIYEETGPNDPPERRNSEEYGITEEDPKADDGIFSQIMLAFRNLF